MLTGIRRFCTQYVLFLIFYLLFSAFTHIIDTWDDNSDQEGLKNVFLDALAHGGGSHVDLGSSFDGSREDEYWIKA